MEGGVSVLSFVAGIRPPNPFYISALLGLAAESRGGSRASKTADAYLVFARGCVMNAASSFECAEHMWQFRDRSSPSNLIGDGGQAI